MVVDEVTDGIEPTTLSLADNDEGKQLNIHQPLPLPLSSSPSPSQAHEEPRKIPSYPTAAQLYKKMPQERELTYKSEATFFNALFFLVKEGWLEFEPSEPDPREILCDMHPDFEATIRQVPMLMDIDFSELREPRFDYAEQDEIQRSRVWQMNACAVHYNMDFGLVTRYLAGEYTAEWRDANEILSTLPEGVSEDDREHIRRIIERGCPAEFNWEEPADNKETFIRRGNNPTVRANMQLVIKTLNKEERNHHIMPFSRWMVRASSYAHHVPQTMIVKRGKKPRLVWDGSTKMGWNEITMNEMTSIQREAPITFGGIYILLIIWIWNLRISFPNEDILLAFVDISACFRFPRVFPDLVGAFGFVIGPWFFAANAMVFGSVASPSSWEPFRRAIALLALAYFARRTLVEKHKELINMVRWSKPAGPEVRYVQAVRDDVNTGIINEDGTEQASPHHIYVDDNLMADIRRRMPQTLASAAEAIFTVMGAPMPHIRQCAVALDKWRELVVSHILVMLGLEFDTRAMTVGVTAEFRAEVLQLLNKTWHDGREAFTVREIELLIGKLARIGQAYRPIYHMMPQLYASCAFALRENKFFMASTSRRFRKLIEKAKKKPSLQEDAREIQFAIKMAAKRIHGCDQRYRIPPSMKREINILRQMIADDTISLSTPFGHIVPRVPQFNQGGDACKYGGGGWSTDLRYWWHLPFDEEWVRRAHLPNNKTGKYISMNVLEMVIVVINLAAAIFFCDSDKIDLSRYPVLRSWCDNTSACSWVNYRCKESMIGRELGKLFIGLLMSTNLGIQAEWLSTDHNVVSDDISRVKENGDGNFDYTELLTAHPSLKTCRQFQPSQQLLGIISDILLNKGSADPLMIRKLKPQTLGSVIS